LLSPSGNACLLFVEAFSGSSKRKQAGRSSSTHYAF